MAWGIIDNNIIIMTFARRVETPLHVHVVRHGFVGLKYATWLTDWIRRWCLTTSKLIAHVGTRHTLYTGCLLKQSIYTIYYFDTLTNISRNISRDNTRIYMWYMWLTKTHKHIIYSGLYYIYIYIYTCILYYIYIYTPVNSSILCFSGCLSTLSTF